MFRSGLYIKQIMPFITLIYLIHNQNNNLKFFFLFLEYHITDMVIDMLLINGNLSWIIVI